MSNPNISKKQSAVPEEKRTVPEENCTNLDLLSEVVVFFQEQGIGQDLLEDFEII